MKGLPAKKLVVFFLGLVLLYLAAFYGLEYLNRRKGPWMATFAADGAGVPSIVVYQPKLGISSVELLFPEERFARSNLVQKVLFNRPRQPVPFGRVIYEDLRSLPGVVTLDLFGHEVEFLPRVLIVNKREVTWKSEAVLELWRTNKPALPPKPPANLPR